MLGKQWLNWCLYHTSGSMVERCGDRQRKFNGPKKWPFRFFMVILPIMLQVALFLLTCGLSRYMWSINTSVARIIISFTVLGFLFYIGIVVAERSSYKSPFQTPASEGLRHLRDSATTVYTGIHNTCRKAGHQVIILLLRIDQAIGNAKRRLVQGIPRLGRAGLLPITTADILHGPHVTH